MGKADKYKGTGNVSEDAKRTQEQTKKNLESKPDKNRVPTTGVTGDALANPDYQMKRAQQQNRDTAHLSPEQKKDAGLPENNVYDPGDSDGDKKAVSPSDRNMMGGDPNPVKDEDPFKDTKAAWDHLASVFGDKVTALQGELEGRLSGMLAPTERETGNPYAGDDVPASKEMTADDVKAALASTADDAKAVAKGVGEVGGAAADFAGTALKDAGSATIKGMGVDTDAVKSTGKTLAGLSGLFSSGDNPNSSVPDGNWKPKSISDLFTRN